MFFKMIRLTLRTVTLLAGTTCVFAESTYSLAPSPESRIELVVTKTGLLRGKQHLFHFDSFGGRLRHDPGKPETSQVQFEIASKSIVCKDTWVSANDLRKIQDVATKDMLDVEHHPKMTFTSLAIRPADAGMFEVRGNLTIRGVTKPVVVTVSVTARAGGVLAIEGRAPVRLTDYGLKPPSAAFGTIGTKDEMTFSFNLAARPE
jgi:polyisoprenoid-binding protein YceI